ncbi:MAG: acetamidase/formamidase family protein [Lautropia sp.]
MSSHPSRPGRTHRLTRDQFVRRLDPATPPAITIDSGDEVIVESWDAFMGAWQRGEQPDHLGPANGPIAVRGAMPGDALRIELLELTPTELAPGRAAFHNGAGRFGFLTETFTDPYPLVMALRDGALEFPGGLRLPVNPSLGFIATTDTVPRRTSSDCGPFGGDIDAKELVAGSTLWLPVLVPGALLCLGDMHATLGDGCVGGTGAECAGRSRIRVTLEAGRPLARPRALTPSHLIAICHGEDLGQAMKQAVRDMVEYLTDAYGLPAYDAYTLLSLAGDIRISRAFRPVSPVKMLLDRAVFDQLAAARAGTQAQSTR